MNRDHVMLRSMILGLAALAIGMVLAPAARADAACGPGQRMVGEQVLTSAAGTTRVPVCAPDNTTLPQGEAITPEAVMLPLNAAIAWGNLPDGTPVYFYTTFRLSSIGAMDDAVGGCETYGALNCRPGVSAAGGWLAVSQAEDGSYFAAYGRKKKDAEKGALARCRQEAASCKVAETIRNN